MKHNSRRTFIRALLISVSLNWYSTSLLSRPALSAPPPAEPTVLGTWKGESVCVGNNPKCKNEIAVYRFEAIPGKVGIVLQLADKIVDGKRDPMGKLEYQYDKAKGELSCEFTVMQTHGLWQLKVTGNSMEGTLVLLPDRNVVRRVNLKKVSEDEVPPPPARESYDSE